MPSKTRREGYLCIDHRDSPGVPQELLEQWAAKGKAALAVGAGKVMECATKKCCHCSKQVILNPDRSRPRGYCRKCDDYVCDSYECNADCNPFAKALDIAYELDLKQLASGLLIPRKDSCIK